MPGRPAGGPGARMVMTVEKPKNGKETISRLLSYFSKEKKMMVSLLVFVIIVVIVSVIAPDLQSKAIDAIAALSFESLPGILIVLAILYVISGICSWFQTIISARLSQQIVYHMREDLFQKIVNLPIKYLDSHNHGDIMSRMTNDVENVSTTISQSLSSLVKGVLTLIGTVLIMLYLCWQLALLSLFTIVMTLTISKLLSGKMRQFYHRRQALLGSLNGISEEMITGFHTIVAYNHQDAAIQDFCSTSNELTRVGIIAEVLSGSMGPITNVINNIGFVIIAVFGGYFALHHVISVGVISAFIVYAKQFSRPINEIAQLYGQIQTALAGAERIFTIMDEPSEDKSGTETMEKAKGELSFHHVDFSYIPGKQVLYDFNLEIKNGQKIALVGATGSGKTTVVNLLMRFYDIDAGEILIDGVNIKDYDCSDLRKNTAIVLQDTVLFSDTIRNNLKYSRPDASDEEMKQAADLSNCHTMITRLTNGYDTVLTSGGQNISQGQRQLLTICRAFLANPKILILDEATSNVDTRTEQHIQEAMVNLMKNRTSLIIAHRLSTIQDADVIVVMDQGHIVETGNHESLLAQKGRYYELYMTQFAGQST
jgi:ATP-binding cassette subfamily B protein